MKWIEQTMKWIESRDADDYFEKLAEQQAQLSDAPMVCERCGQETDTLYYLKVLWFKRDKEVCPDCYTELTRG